MMINNNVEAVNLTNGVILFPSAIDLDWDWAVQTTASLVESEWSDMYVPGMIQKQTKKFLLTRVAIFTVKIV